MTGYYRKRIIMTEFIASDIWKRLTASARRFKGNADVAVAYFSKGAARLLPLAEGSRLVVNASEAAVKAGETHPADLKKLQEAGVRIYSSPWLHAKVFVFGETVFVGSANVSRNSSDNLDEAMIRTTENRAVKAARAFIDGLCTQELGPNDLTRLQKLYWPPEWSGGKRKQNPGFRVKVLHLTLENPPKGSEAAQKQGMKLAQKKMEEGKHHTITGFWIEEANKYADGDYLMLITKEADGSRMVSPTGRVIHIQNWTDGKQACTFIYLEQAVKRRIAFETLASKLGHGWKKWLSIDRTLSARDTDRLIEIWNG